MSLTDAMPNRATIQPPAEAQLGAADCISAFREAGFALPESCDAKRLGKVVGSAFKDAREDVSSEAMVITRLETAVAALERRSRFVSRIEEPDYLYAVLQALGGPQAFAPKVDSSNQDAFLGVCQTVEGLLIDNAPLAWLWDKVRDNALLSTERQFWAGLPVEIASSREWGFASARCVSSCALTMVPGIMRNLAQQDISSGFFSEPYATFIASLPTWIFSHPAFARETASILAPTSTALIKHLQPILAQQGDSACRGFADLEEQCPQLSSNLIFQLSCSNRRVERYLLRQLTGSQSASAMLAAELLIGYGKNPMISAGQWAKACAMVEDNLLAAGTVDQVNPLTELLLRSPIFRKGPEAFFREFMRCASESTFKAWYTLAQQAEEDCDRRPLTAIFKIGVEPAALMYYLRRAPSMYDALMPLELLSRRMNGTEVSHLLRVCNGAFRHLMTIGEVYDGSNKCRVSVGDLCAARSSEEIVQKLYTYFSAHCELLFAQMLKRAKDICEQVAARSEQEQSEREQLLASLQKRFQEALKRVFRHGSGMAPAAVAKLFSRKDFLRLALGMRDRSMLVPATRPRLVLLDDVSGIVTTLFGNSITKCDVNTPMAGESGNLHKVNRGDLRKAAMRSLNREGEEGVSEADLQAVFANPKFRQQVLYPALEKAGVKLTWVTMRIAAKSDPQAWTAGNQVVCCAGLGEENQDDFMRRKDCSHFLVEQGDRVIGMSPVWHGTQQTLLLNNCEVSPSFPLHLRRALRREWRRFFADYARGKIPYIHLSQKQGPRFSRVVVGAAHNDLDFSSLPTVPAIVVPSGDSPRTAGKWNRGASDAAMVQFLLWQDESVISV